MQQPSFFGVKMITVNPKLNKTLFKEAMLGNWDEVVDIYTKNPSAQEAKITRAEDTVLHVAISGAESNVVRRLVDAANDKILALKNESSDTALHVAAALGLVEVCELLAGKSPKLVVEARNKNGETPLFVAAHHGKKKAFFVLQHAIELQDAIPLQSYKGDTVSYCRRGDGSTILHSAIYGEFFDLAFEIINLYPRLINFNNERGQSALHLLANKPLVFKSGSRIRRTDSLVYACIIVDPLKFKYPTVKGKSHSNGLQPQEGNIKLPGNYQTCSALFALPTHLLNLVVACFQNRSRKNCYIAGEEDDQSNSLRVVINQGGEGGSPSNQENQGKVEKQQPYHDSLTETRFPQNYITCFNFFKFIMKVLLVVLGIGIWRIEKIKKKKKKHTHACQLMDELVSRASHWEYDEDGRKPTQSFGNNWETPIEPPNIDVTIEPEGETPVLLAAKRGITEMVRKILDTFPVAAQDLDSNHKNIVLLAVEHRQPHVYRLMLERKKLKESVFGREDKEGNSALHLAAKLGQSRPWIIPGAALQMQWEIKWYKFVKNSMEPSFFAHYNNKGETAREIFTQNHESLVKDGGKWLTNTSQSCSLVAALIATVAFASATTVPGGVKQSGFPTLEGQPAFDMFAISALLALCFSVTSLIMFLAILTSRYQEMDFENDLPTKLIIGLTSLFMSIAAMLVSFCAGHFYVIENKLKYAAFPIYAVTCLPISVFAVAQFPLYVDLIKAAIAHVPERTYKTHTF